MFSSVAPFVADVCAILVGAVSLETHTGRLRPPAHTVLPTSDVVCKNCGKRRVELVYPLH